MDIDATYNYLELDVGDVALCWKLSFWMWSQQCSFPVVQNPGSSVLRDVNEVPVATTWEEGMSHDT